MQVYTVHVFPGLYGPRRRDPVVLREGFCWPAAIFSVFWALAHRLWWTAFGLLVAAAALEVLVALAGLDQTTRLAVFAGYAAIVGFFANDWRRAALERDGWRFAGVIAAPGEDAALRRYFDLAGDAATAPPPAARAFP
jgi:hypothetical protein